MNKKARTTAVYLNDSRQRSGRLSSGCEVEEICYRLQASYMPKKAMAFVRTSGIHACLSNRDKWYKYVSSSNVATRPSSCSS